MNKRNEKSERIVTRSYSTKNINNTDSINNAKNIVPVAHSVSTSNTTSSASNNGKNILVIVDMQNDFVNGVLSNKASASVLPKIIDKLRNDYNKYDAIYMTRDIHFDNYLNTLEGKKLPTPHCLNNSDGKNIVNELWEVIKEIRAKNKFVRVVDKHTFASGKLIDYLSATCGNNDVIEFCGVYTDVCVVSNAICLRAELPNTVIKVDRNCCAGTTLKAHDAALMTMKSCQIDIIDKQYNKNQTVEDIKVEID